MYRYDEFDERFVRERVALSHRYSRDPRAELNISAY